MLKNAYLLARIGADTAENERNFAKNWQLPDGSSAGRERAGLQGAPQGTRRAERLARRRKAAELIWHSSRYYFWMITFFRTNVQEMSSREAKFSQNFIGNAGSFRYLLEANKSVRIFQKNVFEQSRNNRGKIAEQSRT